MKIDMPENYLLILAARGEMGSGELPRSMQLWAQGIVRKDEEMSRRLNKLQQEWRDELRQRLMNIEWQDRPED